MLRRGRIVGATKVRCITEKPMGTTNLTHKDSQSLNQYPGSLNRINLGPLHMCDNFMTWSSWRTPEMGAASIPGTLAGSSEPIPHTPSPVLKHGEVLSLTET